MCSDLMAARDIAVSDAAAAAASFPSLSSYIYSMFN